MQINLEFLAVEALQIVLGDNHICESEFLCLSDTLLNAIDGANLTTQTNLASHAPARFNRGIDVRGEYGSNDREIHSKVGNP